MTSLLTYVWRLVRPHVYSVTDYAELAERDPGAVTVGEMRSLLRLEETSGRHAS